MILSTGNKPSKQARRVRVRACVRSLATAANAADSERRSGRPCMGRRGRSRSVGPTKERLTIGRLFVLYYGHRWT